MSPSENAFSRRRENASSQGFGLGCGLVFGVVAALAALVAIPVFCCGGFGLLGLAVSTGRGRGRDPAPAATHAPPPVEGKKTAVAP